MTAPRKAPVELCTCGRPASRCKTFPRCSPCEDCGAVDVQRDDGHVLVHRPGCSYLVRGRVATPETLFVGADVAQWGSEDAEVEDATRRAIRRAVSNKRRRRAGEQLVMPGMEE